MFHDSVINWSSSFMPVTVILSSILTHSGCSTTPSQMSIDQGRFLGSVWNQGHAEASVVSQDGGYSYRIPGGSLWWFGDTFRGSRDTAGKPHFSGGAVSCAVARLDSTERGVPPVLKFLSGEDGTVEQAIGFLPGESWEHHRIWPLAGVYLNGKSYIYYSLIELTGSGSWDFRSVGAGLAFSTAPFSIHHRLQTPEGWRFPVDPTAIVATEDWIYLFDVQKRGDRQGVWLSRVRPGDIENPGLYQFYCGPGPQFCGSRERQVLLLENIYGQVSVIWSGRGREYVLASSSDFFHPREIRFHTAKEPFGPWSTAIARLTVPEYLQGKRVGLVYCSFFHPELFRDNGRILNLTFSLQLENSGFDANNGMVELEFPSR